MSHILSHILRTRTRRLITMVLVLLALALGGVATALPSQAATNQHNIMLYTTDPYGSAVSVCGFHDGNTTCSGCVVLYWEEWASANLLLDNNTIFTVYRACHGGRSLGRYWAAVPGNNGLTNDWLNMGGWP